MRAIGRDFRNTQVFLYNLKKHPTTCIKISTMVSGMNLIFLGYFLISLAWGNLNDNDDSSSTVLEEEQPIITKEYFREEFDDGGK